MESECNRLLADENEIVVAVDNAPNDHVYPQMADLHSMAVCIVM